MSPSPLSALLSVLFRRVFTEHLYVLRIVATSGTNFVKIVVKIGMLDKILIE